MAFNEKINTGVTPGDGKGDGLRTNMRKLIENDNHLLQQLASINADNLLQKGNYDGTADDLQREITAVKDGAGKTYKTVTEAMAVLPLPSNNTPFRIKNNPSTAQDGDYIYDANEANGYFFFGNSLAQEIDENNTTQEVSGKAVVDFMSTDYVSKLNTQLFFDSNFSLTNQYSRNINSLVEYRNQPHWFFENNSLNNGKCIVVSSSSQTTRAVIKLDLSKMNLQAGESITISTKVSANSAVVRGRVYLKYYEDNNSNIGSADYSNHVNNLSQGSKTISKTSTIPVNAKYLEINLERYLEVTDLRYHYISIKRGEKAGYYDEKKTKSDDAVSFTNAISNYVHEIQPLIANTKELDFDLVPTNMNVATVASNRISNNINGYELDLTNTNETSSLVFKFSENKQHLGTQRIGVVFYVEEPEKLTNIIVNIYSNGQVWARNLGDYQIKKGWNVAFIKAVSGNLLEFGANTDRITLQFLKTEPVKVVLASVFAEIPEKAKLMLIQDHGTSQGFVDGKLVAGQTQSAFQDLLDRKMPIVFALRPLKHEVSDGSYDLTKSEIEDLALHGISRFSFHSYNGESLANSDIYECKETIKRSLGWLQKNGLFPSNFRAAVLQNTAPNLQHCINYMGMRALSTGLNNTGSLDTFPIMNRANLNRYTIHGRTNADIDEKFNQLKSTRSMMVAYTHAIKADNDANSIHMSVSEWNYFLSKIDTAVNEGWLELVGYEELEKDLADVGVQDDDESIINAVLNTIRDVVK